MPPSQKFIKLLAVWAGVLCLTNSQTITSSVMELQQSQAAPIQEAQQQANVNYPHYLQSQIPTTTLDANPTAFDGGANNPSQDQQQPQVVQQRSHIGQLKLLKRPLSAARKLDIDQTAQPISNTLQQTSSALDQGSQQESSGCLYDRSYFSKLDECLLKKPYPTIGLPAFKNEDLLVRGSSSFDKEGCIFVLNNGLFKNFQINKFSLEGDQQCLDNSKLGLSISLNNVTLAYLWTLRCMNRADQLLNDATFDGKTTDHLLLKKSADSNQEVDKGICVGSSQNFGFASMQLSSIDARLELASDLYKNWRVTNITVAMTQGHHTSSARSSGNLDDELIANLGTNIKDYVFESLDGDEMNWRYLHLYQNWARNRLHSNFLDQYRRFLWVSMQNCLGEISRQLPIKLNDLFSNHNFN